MKYCPFMEFSALFLKHSKRLTGVAFLSLVVSLFFPQQGFAWPWSDKPGGSCKSAGLTKVIAKSPYICAVGSKKKLIWLSNPPITDKTRGLALAYLGCAYGSQGIMDEVTGEFTSFTGSPWNGIAYDYAMRKHWFQDPTTSKEMVKLYAYETNLASNISQVLTLASGFDAKWSKLDATWERSKKSVLAAFSNATPQAFGDTVALGYSPYVDAITSYCKIAWIGVRDKSSVEQKTHDDWVRRNSDGLAPWT